ncbi:unnamed protein product [Linum tenue]|uniref:Uncharacterized protein n=1 Tax=Linum tenue TaxID=586396 RepID=A0AAV0IQ87_9ROSI|nr:unnamed protein product [Linum tenue]
MKSLSIFIFGILMICLIHGNEMVRADCQAEFCNFANIHIDTSSGNYDTITRKCDVTCQLRFGDDVFGRYPKIWYENPMCMCFKACIKKQEIP